MTKKGPLGRAESFYVQEHCSTQSTEQIAKDLDRPISTVKKAVDKFKAEHGDQQMTAGSQMARRDGVVIMTENASSASDQSPKKSNKSRSDSCITRIKRDG